MISRSAVFQRVTLVRDFFQPRNIATSSTTWFVAGFSSFWKLFERNVSESILIIPLTFRRVADEKQTVLQEEEEKFKCNT